MKKIFVITACMLAAVSCSDLLDTAPDNQIASGNMWSNEDLADKGMAGLYYPFYCQDLSSTQLRRQTTGLNRQGIEAMGFPTDYYSNNYPVELLSFSTKPANDFQVWYEWRFCFTIIHACNDAIANLGKAGLSSEKYNRYQCEARFLRAWAYNRLNMLYQGVPIYLEPVSNEMCTRTQSTAAEVWKAILDDLNYCIANEYFPDNTISKNIGRPSKGAAYALRGMVYMWLGRDDATAYAQAAADFEQVSACGYDLWTGEYADFFTYENEHAAEMIFAIQFSEETGYCDNIQQMTGARDTYDGWTEIKPSADFVDYYLNADGSVFVWSDLPGFEDWENLTPKQREVYFLRDGLNASNMAAQRSEVIARIGQEIYDTYYLNSGNEARCKLAYDSRDPRLKQTILTPYEPVDCYKPNYNNNDTQIGKQLRWPIVAQGTNGGDFWLDKRTSGFYCYRKYNDFVKDHIISRSRCHTDWPLIRFTDVLLQHAEALAQTGETGKAIELVNRVRTRAHMPELTDGGSGPCGVTGKEDLLERIRYERRVEFCVEGINFFDEVRWGTYKESKFRNQEIHGGTSWWGDLVEYNWYYTDYMWPWTAPQSETQRNASLTKRAGWSY